MNTNHNIISISAVVLLFLGIALAFQNQNSDQKQNVTIPVRSVLETESTSVETMDQNDEDWLETHESNGPEGMQGIPMQRLTQSQALLAILILLAGGAMTLLPQTKPSDTKDSGHE